MKTPSIDEIKNKINKHRWELAVLLVIIVVGIFLRTYHFSQWLHFEIDQTYDTYITSNAVENGVGNLPLLGPTASGGRSLRLGPAFYYLEYLSAKSFGDTPAGHAGAVLVFSIAALPIFYVFCRRIFGVFISLCLLAIFAFSLFMVVYSRFSWSPNVLPFFALLTFYALLRSVSKKEKRKNFWFLLMVTLAAITTQIHFNAFFMVPAIIGLFLLIKRPHFDLKIWAFGFAIVLFIYSPLILSEIKTHGQDTAFFIDKLGNGVGAKEKNILRKGLNDIQYNMYEYFLVISGQDQINGAKMDQLSGYSLGLVCKTCRSGIIWKIMALIYFFSGLLLLSISLRKEKDDERKNFYILIALWFIISFLYYFELLTSFRMKPRFFLLASPLAILILGLILEKIFKLKGKTGLAMVSFITLFLAFFNMRGVMSYFNQLQKNTNEPQYIEVEDVFPNTARLTLEEQLIITNYMEFKYKQNGYPVYIKSMPELEPVFWYHLEKRGLVYWDKMGDNDLYRNGNYFLISAAKGRNTSLGPVIYPGASYGLIEKKDFGSMIVYYLSPRDGFISYDRQDETQKQTTLEKKQVSEIETWNKLFK